MRKSRFMNAIEALRRTEQGYRGFIIRGEVRFS